MGIHSRNNLSALSYILHDLQVKMMFNGLPAFSVVLVVAIVFWARWLLIVMSQGLFHAGRFIPVLQGWRRSPSLVQSFYSLILRHCTEMLVVTALMIGLFCKIYIVLWKTLLIVSEFNLYKL